MTLEQLKEKYADFIASLSDEDKAKVEACKTAEELIALVENSEGELPDDIVEAVAGGKGQEFTCPYCHSDDIATVDGKLKCLSCQNILS